MLSTRFKDPAGTWFEAYVAGDGYQAARKALTGMTPAQVTDEVTKANLRGLGGAGFSTGRKWSFMPKVTTKPKYLVVNADEGEPGTFKDRYILERDPHALLEGMLIAAYAIGSHKAYVYIRGEYFRPAKRLQRAVDEAYAQGWLGKNIQGTSFDLDVVIHRGAGAYICGEETALLTSLEGGKGFPRLKPPFPAVSGLFQCPTIVNNVETLACVPYILRNGAEAFAGIGTQKQGGTRLFCVCGHVARPGVYEEPVRITLRELIAKAGGVRGGKKLKAVVPGGLSAKILTADEIDVAMDFDSLAAAGSMAGSGGVIVMDETTSMIEALDAAVQFFAHESCGQCSPCREGTGWLHRIMRRIVAGQGTMRDLDDLLGIAGDMEGKTICVFADAAAWPVQSYIMKFRHEFEAHLNAGGVKRLKRRRPPHAPPDHRRPRGQRAGGRHGHPGRGAARDLCPAILLPSRALHRRQLPHLPGGGGEDRQAADCLQHAGERRNGRTHQERQGRGRPARGAGVPAGQPSARLPGLRPVGRVRPAELLHELRAL